MSSASLAIHFSRLKKLDAFRKCKSIMHKMFHKYLLITNVGISASLSLGGDLLQQNYEILHDKGRTWDKARTFRMTMSGLTVGTLCHYWYQFLDHKFPGRSLKIVLKKVALDQIVCSPLYITVFFATTCALENSTFQEFKEEFIQKGWRLYLAEWVVWPPAQLINFYFLPTRFRVLYDNTISLGYDVYTSYVKNEIPLDDTEKEECGKHDQR